MRWQQQQGLAYLPKTTAVVSQNKKTKKCSGKGRGVIYPFYFYFLLFSLFFFYSKKIFFFFFEIFRKNRI